MTPCCVCNQNGDRVSAMSALMAYLTLERSNPVGKMPNKPMDVNRKTLPLDQTRGLNELNDCVPMMVFLSTHPRWQKRPINGLAFLQRDNPSPFSLSLTPLFAT